MNRGGRLVVAGLLLAAAAWGLVPGPPPPRATTFDDLIAPLAAGQPVARGYVLSPPRRGSAGDVLFVARRDAGADGPAGRVELHVVDAGRWKGIMESRSFGVAWEVPPPGAIGAAPPEDAAAVTAALFEAIEANDTGFTAVDTIPLAAEPPAPTIARVLDRLSGRRGVMILAAAAFALLLLASLPGGVWAVAGALFAVGLVLRGSALDLPFAHDQDVQRLFTGHSSLRDIATGVGLEDRHPPLYFFVLHAAQQFGQSEAIGRLPAVIAGALVGPALLLAVAAMRGRIGVTAVLAALAATLSPDLIARSREVSEIPLYALLLVAAAAALVAALDRPRLANLAGVAIAHGLALWTYYLAPFVVAAHALLLLVVGRNGRRVGAALFAGVLLGAPALALAAMTLLRDWGARDVARAFPGLAWGDHAPALLLATIGRIAVDAFGAPLLVLSLVVVAVGMLTRQLPVMTPALGALATVAGIVLLSPIARVQAYYATAILPLVMLALAAVAEPRQRAARVAWAVVLAFTLANSLAPLLAGARSLYLPDVDAFMPRFAALVAARPERTVVTVAHYDKTLLAYYLARAEDRPIDWRTVDGSPTKRVEGLALVHALGPGSEAAALERLEALLADGPLLVVERDAFALPAVTQRLSRCELLLQAPTARLVACDR